MAVALVLASCKARPAPETHCFSIVVTANTKSTTSLFEERQRQGGGYTWEGVMTTVAGKLAKLGDEIEQTPDMPGHGGAVEATFRGTHTWYLTDAEGDAATICAGTPAFLDALHTEYDHLQTDRAALAATLDAVPAEDAE